MDDLQEALDPVTVDAVEALGNETRARILHHLRLHGASTRGVLAEELDVNVRTMQHHLALLLRLGVVSRLEKPRSGDDWHRHVYERDATRVAQLVDAMAMSL